MNNEQTTIGLSSKEADALIAIQKAHFAGIGQDAMDSATWFSRSVSTYLSLLALGAAMENHRVVKWSKTGPARRDEHLRMRREFISVLQVHLGRKPTADDILRDIKRVVGLPNSIEQAIRRDVVRLAW